MTIEADVVLSWFSSASSVVGAFSRPTKVVQLPTPPGQKYAAQIASFGQKPLLAILQKYAPEVKPLRVAALGFSQGCQGVRELLRSPDGGRLDAAIAIDGIHAQYQPGSTTKIVPAYLTPWGAMAQRAAQGRTLLAITASTIRPPDFASTSETAAWIWRYATGSDQDLATEPVPADVVAPYSPPVTYAAGQDSSGTKWPKVTYTNPPIQRYRRDHGLVIVNYKDLDPTGHQDHILQGQHILPTILTSFLADRWNGIGPKDGICVLAASEDEATPASCFPPSALSDLYLAGQADPKYLDIPLDSEVDPTIPGTGAPSSDTGAPPPSAFRSFASWALPIVGSAALIGATKYAFDKLTEKRA